MVTYTLYPESRPLSPLGVVRLTFGFAVWNRVVSINISDSRSPLFESIPEDSGLTILSLTPRHCQAAGCCIDKMQL